MLLALNHQNWVRFPDDPPLSSRRANAGKPEEVRVTKAADGRVLPGSRGIRYDHKVSATETGLG